MIAKLIGPLLLSLALTALGLAGGWFARAQTDSGAAPVAEAEGAGSGEAVPVLSPQALKNLGVTWGKAEKRAYVVMREVPAVVHEMPATLQPVVARWGGTVKALLPGSAKTPSGHVGGKDFAGYVVKPGDVILEILRAPLPMIDRALTGEIVSAVSEAVHESATELRSAQRAMDLAEIEWKRVKDLNRGEEGELPVIPRQTEIDLRYEKLKAAAEVDKIRSKLYLHGLSKEQIEGVASGSPVPPSPDLWKRALERNGLWPANGEKVLALLPASLRTHPWTFAGLGEINALGRCDRALLDALTSTKGLGERFHEMVALIQQGHSLPDTVDLYRTGFLDAVVRVRAPEGAAAWEIRSIDVKPGEVIESGARLALLANPERILLELESAGADTALVERALREGTVLQARPLIEGVGPALNDVRLSAFRNAGHAEGAPRAYAVVDNVSLTAEGTGARFYRVWRIREGMRYMVRLPVKSFPGAFPVPKGAVVQEGAERVVYLRSGDGFKSQPVHVLHEDFETAVVADDGTLFPGDPVVLTGAFPLSLALKAEAGGHKPGST
jgi:multidrug efflux pump subunit AcrA (membrane-fusion protein)